MSEEPENLVRTNIRVVDFNKELSPWMKTCLRSGGVPTFRTRFRGLEFKDSLMGVCFAAARKVDSVLFKDVPPEVVEDVKTKSPDWVYLAERFGDEELREFVKKLKSL